MKYAFQKVERPCKPAGQVPLLSAKNQAAQTGCVQGDCVNGQGTYTWASGGKYVGDWKDGKRTGQGFEPWVPLDTLVFKTNDACTACPSSNKWNR